jgi:PAS domain S-box-containing protein
MKQVAASRLSRLIMPFLIGTLFLALYLAWLLWAQPAPQERFWTGSLALAFSALVVLALAWKARAAIVTPALRTAWGWIAAGITLWAAGHILRTLFGVLYPGALRLGPADAVFLAGSMLLLVGILSYPLYGRPRLGRGRLLAEATITTTAIITLAWMIIFKPAAAVNTSSFYYPFAGLLLLLVLLNLFLLNHAASFPPVFRWMILALGATSAGDLAYSYLLPQGGYNPGSAVNFGWVLGNALMAGAVLTQMRSSNAPAPAEQTTLLQKSIARVQSLLPLVLTITLGWYTIIDLQVNRRADPLGLWVTVVLGLALILRQGLVAGEVEFQQYARLVDSIAEPTFICSPIGELRLVNPALLATTGWSQSDELLKMPLQQLIRPSQEVHQMLQQGLRGSWTGEVMLNRSDGRQLPVMLSLRPLAWAGREKLALAGTAHDLTEVKRQQAALQQAYEQIATAHDELGRMNVLLEQRVTEKTASLSEAYVQLERQNLALQNLDRLKSDFVSLVSHELRAPLTNINGGVELVMARVKELPQQSRETLILVQAEIQRLTRFIETILDLSALDAGRVPVYPAPIDLTVVVDAIQRQMTHLPGAGRIRWEISGDLPELLADERAMTSVLFHLVDNALKYAPEGPIFVTAGSQGGLGWVRVEDRGNGIPEEDLPLLFTRFFRSHPSDAQTIYGHGLGLYIVHRLLDAMDGKIEVENRPAGGACFTCWLPLVTEEDAGEENEFENSRG